MNNIKPYKKYKASGIEWLGDIPEHWEVKKVKHLFTVQRGRVIPNTDLVDNGIYPVYSSQTKNKGKLGCINTYDYDGEYISWTTDGVYAGTTFVRKGKFNATNICGLLKLRVENKIDFFGHLFSHIIPYNKRPDTNGAKIMSNEMKDIHFVIPSLPEQTAIASFLDYKTAKIDRFIRKKKQLIKLLNEQKAGIINDAVTKGIGSLDGAEKPKAKMKPSGIEWLGDIPEHWEVRRIGIFGRFSKGGGISRAELLPEGKAAILYGDIYTKYNFEAKNIINRISEETANNSIKLEIGDLLLTGSGETKEDIGKCIAFLSEEDTYAGGDVIIFKQNYNDSLFLSYALNSKGAVYQKILSAKGDIIVHIYGSKLKDIRIPIPPLSEQTAIVSYIEKETTTLNATIATIEKEIALVQEYRTALVAEAVTGKIDVREYCLNQDVEGLEDEQDFEEENADTIENRELNIAAEMEGKYGT